MDRNCFEITKSVFRPVKATGLKFQGQKNLVWGEVIQKYQMPRRRNAGEGRSKSVEPFLVEDSNTFQIYSTLAICFGVC